MNFLLDSDVVSETTRQRPYAVVLDWIAANTSESLFISVITVGELRRDALPAGKKRQSLLHWIEMGIKTDFTERAFFRWMSL